MYAWLIFPSETKYNYPFQTSASVSWAMVERCGALKIMTSNSHNKVSFLPLLTSQWFEHADISFINDQEMEM